MIEVRRMPGAGAIWIAALGLGCAALMLRPLAWSASIATAAAGAIALAVPVARTHRTRWVVPVAIGVAAFAAARAIAPPVGVSFTLAAAAVNTLAAVSEELLFRRAMYGVIERRAGAAWAIAVTAIAFAAIHVPAYGWGVVPIDLAAGALLGWQRAATGTWTAPAATHAVANLLSMG